MTWVELNDRGLRLSGEYASPRSPGEEREEADSIIAELNSALEVGSANIVAVRFSGPAEQGGQYW